MWVDYIRGSLSTVYNDWEYTKLSLNMCTHSYFGKSTKGEIEGTSNCNVCLVLWGWQLLCTNQKPQERVLKGSCCIVRVCVDRVPLYCENVC